MTTGAPIYLVSACASPEQFVAAFRRYAERAGLFVPSAQPLPAGKRGRIALTLADGGVMVEGEAEVLQSSGKPQGLHGRAGMTLKFVELDEPSKIVLGELEKARLAMKPQPPSVAPRPAQVPDEPRAVPPRVGGRIDSANALAECVVIGDVASLREMGGGEAPKAGQKFVIPAIPARSKPPTNAPPPAAAAPPAPAAEVAAVPAPVTDAKSPPKSERRMTSYGMPIVARAPAAPAPPPPTPAATAPSDEVATQPERAVSEGEPALVIDKPPVDDDAAKPAVSTRQTTLGMPAMRPAATLPFGVPTSASEREAARAMQPPPRRAPAPSTPPPMRPRLQTPVAPLPIARPPAITSSSPAIATPDEPEPPAVAPAPAEPAAAAATATFEDSDRAYVGAPPAAPGALAVAPVPAAARSGGMRASEIMAAIPDEDWTMTPDAAQPTVLPNAKEAPVVVEGTTAPKGPPTGDWTITADPQAAGGWSEPAKVEVDLRSPSTGNPVFATAEKALDVVAWEDRPTSIGAKIEIDPTLMEPLQPMPVEPDDGAPPPVLMPPVVMPPILPDAGAPTAVLPPILPPNGSQPQMPAAPPSPYAIPTPAPGSLAIPPPLTTGFAPPPMAPIPTTPYPGMAGGFFPESEPVAFAGDSFAAAPGPRAARRRIVIIASAAAAAVVLVVLIVMLVGGSKHSAAANGSGSSGSSQTPSKIVVAPAHDVGSGSQGSAAPLLVGSAAVAATACHVDVATVPAGAEIALEDKTVLGTTPLTVQLPCNVETKLDVHKSHYVSVVKSVTPSGDTKLDPIRLAHVMFAVKVTSTPPGATITIAGRVAGVTPTSIKLPAFETSTITLAKDGYSPDTEALKVKVNNYAHHVTLKKGAPHHH